VVGIPHDILQNLFTLLTRYDSAGYAPPEGTIQRACTKARYVNYVSLPKSLMELHNLSREVIRHCDSTSFAEGVLCELNTMLTSVQGDNIEYLWLIIILKVEGTPMQKSVLYCRNWSEFIFLTCVILRMRLPSQQIHDFFSQ
ncbi:hypothetical protein TVAGG3_1080250, partial [Trichomonas vaginalis G3]|uniref:uncharacterized protein n=1 Tax=Trichomonas vaginalis (strain ATCC PRA-98 / G3) TaxID=412133 RepID=UPI002156ECC2